ncbi:MAG: hypothetical protein QOI25_4246 [Mycobacterium sp.]|nr:hypothetical protein [Mycobacterium sp.]
MSNALHRVGTEGVKTSVDPSIKPGEDGYVPPTGGKDNLPTSIRDIFDALLHQYDLTGDAEDAAKKAMDARGTWYDLAHDAGSLVPGVDKVISVYDQIPGDPLRDVFVGARPDADQPALHAKNINEVIHLVASYAVAQGAGNLDTLGDQVTQSWFSRHMLAPFDGSTEMQGPIAQYLSNLAGGDDMGWTK